MIREVRREPSLTGRGDDPFKQSMADLSRRLGARAKVAAPDPKAGAEQRREAMQAYDRARVRRLGFLAAGAISVVVAACAVWVIMTLPSSPSPEEVVAANGRVAAPSSSPLSPSQSKTPPVANAAIVPAGAQGASTPTRLEAMLPPPPAPADPVVLTAADLTPPPTPTSTPTSTPGVDPLQRDEVREVQMLLRDFGFNPGPADGAAGPMTEGAVRHYQEQRGQQQTGALDRALLDTLRRDPATRTAPPPPQSPSPSPTRYAQRTAPRYQAQNHQGYQSASQSNPLEDGFRQAGAKLTAWLNSIGR
jgi:hypothetical protein